MSKIYIGIDNGSTGSIAILQEGKNLFFKTPIRMEQSYTKKKQMISRLDCSGFTDILHHIDMDMVDSDKNNILAIVERPYTGVQVKSTISAMRFLEATLILLEYYLIPYQYMDSKEWQKEILPEPSIKYSTNKKMTQKERDKITGMKSAQLKEMSRDIGCRLFPQLKEQIIKHKDADSLLIAEYARRKNL